MSAYLLLVCFSIYSHPWEGQERGRSSGVAGVQTIALVVGKDIGLHF
jgi:hypothetical protein